MRYSPRLRLAMNEAETRLLHIAPALKAADCFDGSVYTRWTRVRGLSEILCLYQFVGSFEETRIR